MLLPDVPASARQYPFSFPALPEQQLVENLGLAIEAKPPMPMEMLGQSYGYIL